MELISEDTSIYNEAKMVMYLYECAANDQDIELDFFLEGPCAQANNLYAILDNFCQRTNYPPKRIKIYTANQLETHPLYTVVRRPEYWYEVEQIKRWSLENTININKLPTKHFGIFVGRGSWDRAWISTILHRYQDKTVQTFHSGYHQNYVIPRADSIVDTIGLDLLNQYGCDIIPEVATFLQKCPLIDQDNLELVKQTREMFINPNNDNCYPIQHPANLNILPWYQNIVVDIICETRIIGNIFFATEKLWRCMVAGRPFIIMGSQHYLQNLQRLGFQTFSEFWDEGYDDHDPAQRIKAIEKLIQSLANKSLKEMQAMLFKMKPILDHNLQRFQTLTFEQIAAEFDE
jgi:hypothetical protein